MSMMTNDKLNIAFNKKANYNFSIEQTIESGLILKGWEVKSLRNKKVNITNGYLFFRDHELYLMGLDIQPCLNVNNYYIHQSNRNIKILLHKKEISYLYGKFKIKGYSLIALSLYWKRSWCKLKIAVCKGKTNYDKRFYKKKQDWKNQQQMIIKKII